MPRAEDTWQLGGRVDRYRLDAELGRGGMGVVYAATDADTGRRVAIKTLLPNATPTMAERFVREGLAQAAVDEHPNVLRVHSAGEAGGRRYLVMDLATGGDLGARLKQGPLPPLEAAAIARDLARGLAHVHARGITHRDLKPGNVLFDERGTPRLVDFGLAIVEGEERLTRTGNFVGTPAYMAPEQLDGRADARADVYGLGAVLFHMLTGQPPFTTENRMALLAKLVTTPAPSAQELNPAVPEGLERVVRRCLAKRPVKRYATAAALADDLERAIAGEQVEAPQAEGGLALVVALAVAAFLLPVVGGLAWRGTQTAAMPPVDTTPVVTATVVTQVDVRGADDFDDLEAPPTLGLPTEARTYGCQWQFVSGTPGWVSFRGTLTLGPAVVTDRTVTCPGALSELTVWGGGGAADRLEREHRFDGQQVPFTITITPTRELVVTGLEPQVRETLLALMPEDLRRNPFDVPGQAGAWPGRVVSAHLSNEVLGHVLELSLPWTAIAVSPVLERVTAKGVSLSASSHRTKEVRILIDRGESGLEPESEFGGSWSFDAVGLVRCELREDAQMRDHPTLTGGTWWFVGPPEEFEQKKRGPRTKW
jgi:hypothetical protein